MTGKRDLLSLHIAEIYIAFPVICSNVNRTIEPKGKGKAIPLQAWAGPEGYRMLRLPDSMTVGA